MKQAKGAHPRPEQLAAFVQGRLPPRIRASVEDHVAECEACCEILRQIPDDTLVGQLRQSNTSLDGIDHQVVPANAAVAELGEEIPPELQNHPRYRILKILGVGGMGVVYQAEHRLMERTVALKVISRRLTSNATVVERFRTEVKAAARLQHPHIVTAYDAEQAGDLHFLVMEYVEGINLARLVEKRGPLPVAHACHYIRQAALGLQHAFEQGMVHRDIKPHNLMLARKGLVKILDFGLARLAQRPQGQSVTITKPEMLLGTPDFFAPEQANDARAVDIRADIYSLGCTLYFLLAGKVPFPAGNTLQKMRAHLQDMPQPLSAVRADVPPELAAIVERMLAKDPSDRYQTPAEIAQALTPLARPDATRSDEPPEDLSASLAGLLPTAQDTGEATAITHADVPSRRTGTRRPRRRRRVMSAGTWIGPVALVALVLGLAAIWQNRSAFLKWGSEPSPEPVNSPLPRRVEDAKAVIPVPNRPAVPEQVKAFEAGRPPRVLFLLPSRDFWYPDYGPVRQLLERAGAKVAVVSSIRGLARRDPNGGGEDVPVDLVLGQVNVADFDALFVVGGKGLSEYLHSQPNAPACRQMVRGMRNAGKYVTALCMGTGVLANAGVLQNKRAVGHHWLRPVIQQEGAIWTEEPVVVDPPVITGRDSADAQRFAATLLQRLQTTPSN